MLLDFFIAIIALGMFLEIIVREPGPLLSSSSQVEMPTAEIDKHDFSARMQILQERLELVNESKIL